jgi:hypothetical protein
MMIESNLFNLKYITAKQALAHCIAGRECQAEENSYDEKKN